MRGFIVVCLSVVAGKTQFLQKVFVLIIAEKAYCVCYNYKQKVKFVVSLLLIQFTQLFCMGFIHLKMAMCVIKVVLA